jgi:hypothetical protein
MQASIDRIRTAARWLLGAFGAIGAALAIGAQFSNLGKLQGGARDWALVGVGLTFAGIGLAIAAGAAVLAPRSRSLREVAEREQAGTPEPGHGPLFRFRDPALELFRRMPELLTPFRSVHELVQERTRLLDAYDKEYSRWSRNRTTANKKALDKASDDTAVVEDVANSIGEWVNYTAVRSVYRRALVFGVFPGVIAAAAGLTLFALKIPDVPPTHTPADVRVAGVDFEGLDLHGVRLHGADLTKANLAKANLSGADLAQARLDGANLAGADLSDANLDGASLTGADTSDAIWRSTTCPDGRLSDDVGGSCLAHLAPVP